MTCVREVEDVVGLLRIEHQGVLGALAHNVAQDAHDALSVFF